MNYLLRTLLNQTSPRVGLGLKDTFILTKPILGQVRTEKTKPTYPGLGSVPKIDVEPFGGDDVA